MENFEYYRRLIDESIAKIGLDPETTRGPKPGQWSLRRGTAQIVLDLFQFKKDGPLFFSAMAPIMKTPKSNLEKLITELLKMNHGMAGVAFSIYGEFIFIRGIREVAGMDVQEAVNLITRVGNSADYYDEKLQKMFPHHAPIGFKTGGSDKSQV